MDKIPFDEISDHVLLMRELSKDEKDMYIMGKLKSKGTGTNTESSKRKRFAYCYDDREVCKEVFLISHDIGEKYLKNLIKHMKENGPTPRRHGNTGKRPKHALAFEDIKRIVKFIVSYANDIGLPLPAVRTPMMVMLPFFCPHQLQSATCTDNINQRARKLETELLV